jgi:hypothetical protein
MSKKSKLKPMERETISNLEDLLKKPAVWFLQDLPIIKDLQKLIVLYWNHSLWQLVTKGSLFILKNNLLLSYGKFAEYILREDTYDPTEKKFVFEMPVFSFLVSYSQFTKISDLSKASGREIGWFQEMAPKRLAQNYNYSVPISWYVLPRQ